MGFVGILIMDSGPPSFFPETSSLSDGDIPYQSRGRPLLEECSACHSKYLTAEGRDFCS